MDWSRVDNLTWLTVEQFSAMFNEEWAGIRQSFLKLEAAPVFVEDDDESFDAFASGDIETALKMVQERVLEQRDMFADVTGRGARIARLRVVGRPVTPYIRDYEAAGYEVSAEIGETVRFIDEGEIPSELQRFYRDMLIFDRTAVLVHEYSPWGRLLGAWHTRNNDVVASCWQAWETLNNLARDSM